MNLPRCGHGEPKCREEKEVELERFDEYDAYEVVKDEGQKTLGTNWVITEKVKEGQTFFKARLTFRGDQEATDDIQTDSPTVRRGNINIILTAAACQN